MKKEITFSIVIILAICSFSNVFGQQHTDNKADQILRGNGRVNPSTLGMEIDISLGAYGGRGIAVPIGLSYSSKVWRMDSQGAYPVPATGGTNRCVNINLAKFGENSAAGWTTSMQTVYVEYTGFDNLFTGEGYLLGESIECIPGSGSSNSNGSYIRRIQIHLPSGESHEMRMDDSVKTYDRTSNCTVFPSQQCDGNTPSLNHNWNGWYFAVDGSNMKYFEDRTNNIYVLLLPDGSRYNFVDTQTQSADFKTIRKASSFNDRNGNQTTYHEPNAQHPEFPNGYWTDTLGRILGVPLPKTAPTAPTVQTYTMPGLSGNTPITYKFHWKKLKDSSAANSALTNFNQALKFTGDWDSYPGNPNPNPQRASETTLFHSSTAERVVDGSVEPSFNPILLTAIELPNGQLYRFSYNIYGEIDRIYYPTGAKESFDYYNVPSLTFNPTADAPTTEVNRGVAKRNVFISETAQTSYEWTYLGAYSGQNGYKVTINNPDGTRSERYLYQDRPANNSSVTGDWGFNSNLAGMAYEERGYSAGNQIISKTLRSWTKTALTVEPNGTLGDWHPRVTQETSYIYDMSNNGISTTSVTEYEGNLNLRETPLLSKKTSQYDFVIAGSPLPQSPLRTSETTYLQSDPNIAQTVKDIYKVQNMIGLVTASVIKDGAGTIVSRSEMLYDESGYSPNVGRGNPTTARVWDSTKGSYNDPDAYISTHARFDTYGNQYEAIDAKGNSTFTTFDATHHAFPIQVTTTAPDPSGDNGSDTGFTTTSTFDPITGLPLTTTDANGLETRIEYDPVTLRPKNTKNFYQNNQVGGMAETIYHDEPNNYWVKSRAQIDVNKWAESITYFDGLGRAYKSEEVNSKGNIFVEKEFDADGRVYRVTNPFRSGEAKAWTTNIYDNSSRVIEVVLPDGAKVKTDYGVSVSGIVGTTKQITDQAGKKRKGISDGLGRMVRVIEDPTGQNLSTDYVFDTLGNLRKTIQGEQSRYFTYDSLGRLRYAKQPEQESNTSFNFTDPITNNSSWSVKYEYDNNGNITTTTDARGVSVSGIYDNFNRLKLRDYSDDTPDVSFYYDGKGLPSVPNFAKGKTTRIASSVSETRYTSFDNLGRLLTHEQITDGKTYPTEYQYNLSGAITSETYPSGRVMTQNLDQDGILESLWGQKANQNSAKLYLDQIRYNSAGNIEKMRLGNGRWETAAYNNRQQIVQIGLGYSNNDKSLLKLDYSYGTNLENNGSLREQKINFAGISNEIKQTYTYDDLNRLKSSTETVNAQVAWKQTFNYDRYGNRTFDANNTNTISGTSAKVANPDINTSDNRLKKDQDNDNTNDYDYDKAGNLTLDAENQRFIYDADNRLKQFFSRTNSGINPDTIYQYDGNGRRVIKKNNVEEVIFVYNASGTLIAEYSTKMPTTAKVSYLTADNLGSPRIVTDESGTVVSRHDYTAFGGDVAETLGNVGGRTNTQGYGKPDEIRKQYTGYENDDESNLEYAQARYYNSSHGRFTSIDPLIASANTKNPQTFNRYTYALNSPYKFTDPLGLIAVCCTDVDEQIEQDWKKTISGFTLDDESMEKLKKAIRPFYQKVQDQGQESQRQLDNANETGNIAANSNTVTTNTSTQNGTISTTINETAATTTVDGTLMANINAKVREQIESVLSETPEGSSSTEGTMEEGESASIKGTKTDSEKNTNSTTRQTPTVGDSMQITNSARAQALGRINTELNNLNTVAKDVAQAVNNVGTLTGTNNDGSRGSTTLSPIVPNITNSLKISYDRGRDIQNPKR